MRRRVAVTGIGVVTPLGCSLDSLRSRLLAGESAAGTITAFDPASLPTRIAAQVDEDGLEVRTKDRKIGFGVQAARRAVEDARPPKGRAGLSLGIGLELFSMPDMVRLMAGGSAGPDEDPSTFLQTPSDACVHWICREQGLRVPPLTHISACAASTDAVGAAFRMVRDGEADWMLAGGTDSMVNPMGVGGFCKITAMTTRNDDPKRASRPFDKDRDGFLLGEGAAMLVLEPLEAARARGADLYAELGGYGTSFDAHGISEPHPEGEGALLAMHRALEDAGVRPDEVVYVNAHGTSTPKNDPVETLALRRLLGPRASQVPVSSTKSMLGHCISAAGAIELAAMMACAQQGLLHPTINLDDPDPVCDLDYVPEGPRRLAPGWCLKNSFGFGGQNASLAVRLGGIP